MALTRKLGDLAHAVARMGDEAVTRRDRPPISERLAALREARAAAASAGGESLRGPVAIGAALGLAASVILLLRPAGPLTFAVGEPTAAGEVGGWVVAPPSLTVPIGFSDGTRVRLEGGARVRVLAVDAHGARVMIERGTVRAEVVPRADNDWWVVGGPFEIHVTGTRFDAGWDPEREVLRVSMHEGRVVVRAPCLEHERALVAGDSVSLSCAAARGPVTGSLPPAPPIPSGRATAATARATPGMAATAPGPSPADGAGAALDAAGTADAPRPSWRDLARRSEHKAALAAAEAEGWGPLCDGASAADLLELGTTARLAGRGARAVEAYTALRRRFAGTDAAAVAAFHLGKLAFDGAHAFAEAHRWFETYLTERPGGGLAAEALGRAMESEQRLGDLARARQSAERYLARYPGGAHAELARSLLAP